jgi:Ser/Thr protein kinase RdoA (MazF antagonist)
VKRDLHGEGLAVNLESVCIRVSRPNNCGQELLDAGNAEAVLRACGTVLRRIHDLATAIVGFAGNDANVVLVHGDYRPNNVLIDPATLQITGVVDWEFAHLGSPVEDLAWCEWIVRMHHPNQVGALDNLFDGYGGEPPTWALRRATMLARCAWLEDFCRRWAPDGPAVRLWQERASITAAWEAAG